MTERFQFDFSLPALEKEMATHSSVLAWRIPGTGEPGGLLSMGLHRVECDLAAAAEGPRHRLQEKSCKSSIQQMDYHEIISNRMLAIP